MFGPNRMTWPRPVRMTYASAGSGSAGDLLREASAGTTHGGWLRRTAAGEVSEP